jgi:UDP-glucuronate 4-epimerase
MAYFTFTKAILAGKPIDVYNHGKMQRDFTFIDDIVAGVKAALFTSGLAPYEVLNLGNHHSEKLMDMIETLGATLGVKPVMDLLPMQPGDVPATYADITRAEAKLGFRPTPSLAQGLPKFVTWYRQYHSIS